MTLYRRRPQVIEAVRFDPSSGAWPEGVYAAPGSRTGYKATTLIEDIDIEPGDFVVPGPKGICTVCKAERFLALYEMCDPLSIPPREPKLSDVLSEEACKDPRVIRAIVHATIMNPHGPATPEMREAWLKVQAENDAKKKAEEDDIQNGPHASYMQPGNRTGWH